MFMCNKPLFTVRSFSHYLFPAYGLLYQWKVKSLSRLVGLEFIHAALWLRHEAIFQAVIIKFYLYRRREESAHTVQLLRRIIEDLFPLHIKKVLARLEVYLVDKRGFPRSKTLKKRLMIDQSKLTKDSALVY